MQFREMSVVCVNITLSLFILHEEKIVLRTYQHASHDRWADALHYPFTSPFLSPFRVPIGISNGRNDGVVVEAIR